MYMLQTYKYKGRKPRPYMKVQDEEFCQVLYLSTDFCSGGREGWKFDGS
jgi:hypothetical protein